MGQGGGERFVDLQCRLVGDLFADDQQYGLGVP
ncbi:MAG: hypothetical protein JWO49_1161 [Arthrobacter sp.]|nr:hypothetical protein [Arthrobacter sp.]